MQEVFDLLGWTADDATRYALGAAGTVATAAGSWLLYRVQSGLRSWWGRRREYSPLCRGVLGALVQPTAWSEESVSASTNHGGGLGSVVVHLKDRTVHVRTASGLPNVTKLLSRREKRAVLKAASVAQRKMRDRWERRHTADALDALDAGRHRQDIA